MDIVTTFFQLLLIVLLLGITIIVIGFAVATAITLIKHSLRWVPKTKEPADRV